MYRISVPIMVTSPTYDRDAVLSDLRRAGAERVFLAFPPVSTDEKKQNEVYEKLARDIPFYRENGLQVGVWFWAFWVGGENSFTKMTGITGKTVPSECCPLDEDFLAFAAKNIGRVASVHPDLIQFDDDFRFGVQSGQRACTCPLHRKLIEKYAGEKLPDGDVSKILLGGKPNKFRSAFIRANGESLRNFARTARKAVDEIDPKIRMGQCACIGTYDLDGTDSFEISKILAGNTKPFLRLIGAPYWADNTSWGNRLQDVIELERMQRSWYDGDDIEIFSEGDAYPRPRFHTPASYVELFDAALRADGSLDGILKYMADYTASSSYETGYFDRHVSDEASKSELLEAGKGLACAGIRVYSPMKSAEDADFTDCPTNAPDDRFFPHSSRSLVCSAIPTTYRGSGVAGIAFGEEARHLPDSAFNRPLILDARGAKILSEMGKDVGISVTGKIINPERLRFPEYNEIINVSSRSGGAETVPDGAKVLAAFESEGKEYPFCTAYENKLGEKYLVFAFDVEFASEDLWRNYAYPRIISDVLKEWDAALPAVCPQNPDLYMICKEKDGKMLVSLFNCFADEITGAKITLSRVPKGVISHRSSGSFDGKVVTCDKIPAFNYVWMEIKL